MRNIRRNIGNGKLRNGKNQKENARNHTFRMLFWVFLAIGIFVRVWKLGIVPGDINQDEAFSGYEAYSLLHYGMDSAGYPFPVYLTVWGSGMSALNSYLMIPFIALFGAHVWVIRLPQVIVACLTLWASYLLVRQLFHEKAALCALFLLAVSPWHITMSRWGLDANLAPGFLIFGLLFFVKGLERPKYLLLSALMYGLSLYCYATIWVIVPLILLLQSVYGLVCRKLTLNRWGALSVLLLGILALPLILFVLVNMGVLEEIKLSFFSVPRLLYMRASEISLENIPEKAAKLWHIMKDQTDYLPWNGTGKYGIYYMGTLSFFVLGLFYCVKTTIEHWLKKEYTPEFFLLVQVGAGILLGLLVDANINRVNILFIPMILTAALGVYYLCSLIDLRYLILPGLFYLVLFLGFEHYYFTEYRQLLDSHFCRGLGSAVEEAVSYEGTVYFSRGLTHPRILFFTREPVTEYIDTVEYYNYPSAFLDARSFGRYSFEFDPAAPDRDATYVLSPGTDLTAFEQMGFTMHVHGNYTVAHCFE